MPILTTTPWNSWPVPTLPVRPFTVSEYHQLIDIGMVDADDPVELLEGWITPKMPRNPPHDATVGRTSRTLDRLLPPDWITRVQGSIQTSDSQPEPDVAVILGPDDRYDAVHPGAADIGLLVEVSDSSLARDRGEKARLYARAGICCYWIVNLQDMQIEVYTEPTGPDKSPRYQRRQDFRSGDVVPVTVGGLSFGTIAVADLLPAQR